MTDKLSPNLLALFAPRPPLRWVPQTDYAPEERKTRAITGVAGFLPAIKAYETEYDYHPTESWLEKRDRKMLEKKVAAEKLLVEVPKDCEFSPDLILQYRQMTCRKEPLLSQRKWFANLRLFYR
jgi:U1 small nuclear ribonucleoprotein